MSSEAQVRTLLSEIEQSRAVLGRVAAFYQEYLARTDEVRDRTAEQAIVLAEVFVSYFEFEYDWDRLAFIRKKFDQVHPLALADLDRFGAFLRGLLD